MRFVRQGAARKTGPRPEMMAMIWAPVEGDIHARFPGRAETWLGEWLRNTCQIKRPMIDRESGRFILPRNSLSRVAWASIDAFGAVTIYRDVRKLSKCDKRCQAAEVIPPEECECACLGDSHGIEWDGTKDAAEWVELDDTKLLTDDYGTKRIVRVMRAKSPPPGEPRMYGGELRGRRYTTNARNRRDWPKSGEFVCASCLTSRARVWDHCHAHGYVRAPLCNKCNTREWDGWAVEYGRTRPSTTIDLAYYEQCGEYDPVGCSG